MLTQNRAEMRCNTHIPENHRTRIADKTADNVPSVTRSRSLNG